MHLPAHKTKIVATIGPASESLAVMEQLLRAGMNIARLNFSHGDFDSHRQVIANLRGAAHNTGKRLTIMADLPGPKMRIGRLAAEPVQLVAEQSFTLTTADIVGDTSRASVSFPSLPDAVRPGNTLFLNDGIIRLEVTAVRAPEVVCRVVVGGELRSHKGLNLPGIDLGMSAFTARDRECLAFALTHGVDAVGQSFVARAADIEAVRGAARELGYAPFVLAKIERTVALGQVDAILAAADGIMVARGDLGVEAPIEEIPVLQKRLIHAANQHGKPVITATQMLESMTTSARPTRAEATDVTNAVIDGTDCVMLSGESAVGKFPVEAVQTLARIAAAAEPLRQGHAVHAAMRMVADAGEASPTDLLALTIENALAKMAVGAVVVPCRSGATVRRLARFRLPAWIAAVSDDEALCQALQFSFGIFPEHAAATCGDWRAYACDWAAAHETGGDYLIVIEGPSAERANVAHRMEIVRLQG